MVLCIEKKDFLDSNQFEFDYIQTRCPVVFKEFFHGEAISKLDTKEKFILEQGSNIVSTEDLYYDAIGIKQVQNCIQQRLKSIKENLNKKRLQPLAKHIALSDYFNYVDSNFDPRNYHISFSPTNSMLQLFKFPTISQAKYGEIKEIRVKYLIGSKGYFSQLHFDKDACHGLLYQVYGNKKLILIPTSSTSKLFPFTQFSSIFLQNYTQQELQNFLDYVEGAEITLNPGDCAYIPPFIWHFIDYPEDSCSINIRFRQRESLSPLIDHMFPDVYMQSLCVGFLEGKISSKEYHKLIKEIKDFVSKNKNLKISKEKARKMFKKYIGKNDPLLYTLDVEEYFPSPLPSFYKKASYAN